MKKVLLILILFLSCYFVYNFTNNQKMDYLTIGDALSKGVNEYGISSYGYSDYVKDYLYNDNRLREFNKTFTNSDYRITDVIKILEYNEKKNDDSLNRLIKKADIITVSLGMNEIYYKLDKNNKNIYTYVDNLINDYNKVLSYIGKFNHERVFILGYYNVTGKNQDIFDYANLKLKELCNEYGFNYLDLSKLFDNNPSYTVSKDSFIPNRSGYEKISQIIVAILKDN